MIAFRRRYEMKYMKCGMDYKGDVWIMWLRGISDRTNKNKLSRHSFFFFFLLRNNRVFEPS